MNLNDLFIDTIQPCPICNIPLCVKVIGNNPQAYCHNNHFQSASYWTIFLVKNRIFELNIKYNCTLLSEGHFFKNGTVDNIGKLPIGSKHRHFQYISDNASKHLINNSNSLPHLISKLEKILKFKVFQ